MDLTLVAFYFFDCFEDCIVFALNASMRIQGE